MKSIMIMYDSLNKHMLSAYGCDWTKTPNFQRLSKKSITFENMYVGSMPCMPARRELHTGRYNFLHRSWGPFEPFDDSTPEILQNSGIYTHLVSDHYHYWEDGGATYHHRYSSWENVRGQEGDKWKGEITDPILPEHLGRVEDKTGSIENTCKMRSQLPKHRPSQEELNLSKRTGEQIIGHCKLKLLIHTNPTSP